VRAYGAALLLTASVVGAVPASRLAEPPAFVRPLDRRLDHGFDERELVGGLALTLPLTEESRLAQPELPPPSVADLN